MQRRELNRFRPFCRSIWAPLAALVLAHAGGCVGSVGPTGANSGTGGAVTGSGGKGPGSGGASSGGQSGSSSGGSNGSASGGSGGAAGASGAPGSGGAGSPDGSGGAPVVFAPSAGAYRRLTASAFRNSLRDLLQIPVTVGELEPDSWSIGGFPSVSAATVAISATGVEQYQAAIDAATTTAFADSARRSKLLGCAPKSATDMACFQSFVTKFGRLAWRQPLTSAQVARYATLIANAAASLGDLNEAMRAASSEERPPPTAAAGSGSTRAARSRPGCRTS